MRRSLPLITGLLLLAACSSPEQQIKDEIAEANYCETPADCVDVGGKCPFDCYIFVNKNEADRIRALVEGYESQCTYSCIAIKGVDCIRNTCQPIQDAPPAAEVEENPEGNIGAACESHEECQTPMSYLTRSVCPFSSRCIDDACAVVCPMFAAQPNDGKTTMTCTNDTECDCRGFAAGDPASCRCVDNEFVAVMGE